METQPTVASTVAPSNTAANELAQLQALTGGNSGLTVVMGLIAVLGGSAAWKFWNNHAKLKHEEKMKQMELEAELAKKGKSKKKKK
jgi:predicted negative regulator of RcsB-dependent stress response